MVTVGKFTKRCCYISGSNDKESIIYTTENFDPSVNSMVRHHFHLHHGDFVRVEVTATNKADSSTPATSNGVKIDLTEPKMSQLVDGGDLNDDMQYTVIITLNSVHCHCFSGNYNVTLCIISAGSCMIRIGNIVCIANNHISSFL